MKIRRRTLIQGLGATTLAAAPFLNRMAHAQEGAPKRLVILATGQNSLQKELWGLDGLESGAPLPAQSAPTNGHLPLEGLQEYRDRLNVLLRLDAMPGNSGHRNSPQMLTGVTARVDEIYSAGISIDAHISQALLGRDPMALGALVGRPPINDQTYLSFAGGGLPITPRDHPRDAFESYLLSVDPTDPNEVRRAGRRQAIRDVVRSDLSRLRQHVSREDFERVERHLEGLDAIEARLGNVVNCSPEAPVLPAGYDPMSAQSYPDTIRMQIDIAAAALACDAHRVVTLQFGQNGPNYIYPTWPEHGLDYSFNEHRAAHRVDMNDNDVGDDPKIHIETWYNTFALKYLLDKLDGTQDSDGQSVLDNTLVVRLNHFGATMTNTHKGPSSMILAGGLGGEIETGRVYDFPTMTNNDLYTAMCQKFGLDDDSFGDIERNNEPLPI